MATSASFSTPNVAPMAHKHGLPPYRDDDLEQWLFELSIWESGTDLPAEKRGPVLFLSLNSKMRKACSSLSKDTINKADGFQKITEKLRELYGITKEQATFAAYEDFENFHRSDGMSIKDYINSFEELDQKLINYEVVLPSVVLAYRLLKNANLPKEQRNLARATVADLTYKSMKTQIKAIFDSCTSAEEKKETGGAFEVEIEQDSALYGQFTSGGYRSQNPGRRSRGRNRFRGSNDRQNKRNALKQN